eukprot:m.252703 g.252703  ORF g.252703 m.252703 type:complete len:217 (-) comp17941_c0_seq1:54-704(-)
MESLELEVIFLIAVIILFALLLALLICASKRIAQIANPFMAVVVTFGIVILVVCVTTFNISIPYVTRDYHKDSETTTLEIARSTAAIVEAMEGLKTSMRNDIESLKSTTTFQINSLITTMEAKHAETGTRLLSLDYRMTKLASHLEKTVKSISSRLDDLEDADMGRAHHLGARRMHPYLTVNTTAWRAMDDDVYHLIMLAYQGFSSPSDKPANGPQ